MKKKQLPKPASWARLDSRIDPKSDGTGVILLALFKMADINGHNHIEDVCWFVEKLNECYLSRLEKTLPVPSLEDLKLIMRLGTG